MVQRSHNKTHQLPIADSKPLVQDVMKILNESVQAAETHFKSLHGILPDFRNAEHYRCLDAFFNPTDVLHKHLEDPNKPYDPWRNCSLLMEGDIMHLFYARCFSREFERDEKTDADSLTRAVFGEIRMNPTKGLCERRLQAIHSLTAALGAESLELELGRALHFLKEIKQGHHAFFGIDESSLGSRLGSGERASRTNGYSGHFWSSPEMGSAFSDSISDFDKLLHAQEGGKGILEYLTGLCCSLLDQWEMGRVRSTYRD